MKDAGILLYNIPKEKGDRISLLCNKLNIKVKWVEPREFTLPIEKLADFRSVNLEAENSKKDNKESNKENDTFPLNPDNINNSLESFRGEMFVMVNFSEELLDRFLKEYKMKQIEPVFLKAILTPHNKSWNSLMLNKELMRERLEMSRFTNKK